ncbi:MAG: DinB family protein, partial [Planctomycetota bacterium]
MTAAEVDLLWRTDPTPYQQRIQALLGDRDPLEVLSQTPQRLAQIVAANSVERLRSRPAPGKWTPNEILGHLADTEWAHGWRMRTVLGGRQAVIVG